ncbi:MAG: hypothetical protein NTY86_18170 [Deltaproteobacteria bacterium]|nr:hypothetical protein [Deltaproteobacteria bacterium]
MKEEEANNFKNLFESSPLNKDRRWKELVEESLREKDLLDERDYEAIDAMRRRINVIGTSIPISVKKQLGEGLKVVEMLLKLEKRLFARIKHPIDKDAMADVLSIILAQVVTLAILRPSTSLDSLWEVVDSLNTMINVKIMKEKSMEERCRKCDCILFKRVLLPDGEGYAADDVEFEHEENETIIRCKLCGAKNIVVSVGSSKGLQQYQVVGLKD